MIEYVLLSHRKKSIIKWYSAVSYCCINTFSHFCLLFFFLLLLFFPYEMFFPMIANFRHVKICFEFIYNSHEWCRICLNKEQFLLIDFIRFPFCWPFNVGLVHKWIYIPKKNSCRINRMVNKFLIAYTPRFPRWMRSKFDARGYVRWPVGSIYTFFY